MQRIIRLRNRHGKTFGRGSLTVLPVENERVLAYTREHEGETILVVANLSRFAQATTLPLQGYAAPFPGRTL
jgi:maltose alpha-D-glucosyltransferase/alpha-amylase